MFYPLKKRTSLHPIQVVTTPPDCPPLPAERYSKIDVGFRPRIGARSCPGPLRDHSPATDRRTVPGTQTAALSAPTGLEQTSTAPGVVLPVRRRQRKRSPARRCFGQLALPRSRESQSGGVARWTLANRRKPFPA